eukprot:scaffold55321_cov75-Attheya_sp.AAC.2
MTEDEKENQKGISGLFPLGVGETVCGCIAKMTRPCARKKLGANLSEAEIELLVAHAMGFLHMDNTVQTAKRLVKIAASNAAVIGAVSARSVVTVIGGTGVAVAAAVLIHTVLNPVYIVRNMNKPTPSPSPYPTITPKVQCPDAGAAMFVGYKISNTSEDMQLLMVTLTDLPERLELFVTNSFSLPTMNEEFTGNNTGSMKVWRNHIIVYIEREV